MSIAIVSSDLFPASRELRRRKGKWVDVGELIRRKSRYCPVNGCLQREMFTVLILDSRYINFCFNYMISNMSL